MSLTPDDILQKMEVPGYPHVYLIGRNARRLTFLSQQYRALNLIWALNSKGFLESEGQPARIAVIGGGLAGMTAAVAANWLRARVTLLERKSELLHIQRGCQFRFVHPNIYDWPDPRSTEAQTDLPCMNWGADLANSVAESILNQWEALAGKIRVLKSCDINRIAIDRTSDKPRPIICAQGPDGNHYQAYDCVILAVGFGLERTLPPVPFLSYWENDNFSRPVISEPLPRRYLVSGCGDGGLIDATRLCVRGFDHARFVLDLISMEGLEDITKELPELDRQAHAFAHVDPSSKDLFNCDASLKDELLKRISQRSRGPSDEQLKVVSSVIDDFHSEWLYDRYTKLNVPDNLLQSLRQNRREDTVVTLNGPNRTPLDLNSSILSRFIIFLLWQFGRLRYIPGRVSVRSDNIRSPWKVEFRDTWGGIEVREFDEFVVRHGFVRSIERLFPSDLVKTLSATAASQIDDPTRIKQFDDGFLDASTLKHWKNQARLDHAISNTPRAAKVLFYPAGVKGFGIHVGDYGPGYVVSLTTSANTYPVPEIQNFAGVPIEYKRSTEVPEVSPSVRPLICGLPIGNIGPPGIPYPVGREVLGRGTLGGFVRLAGKHALLTSSFALGDPRESDLGHRIAQPGFTHLNANFETVASIAKVAWPIPSPFGASLTAGTVRFNEFDGALAIISDSVEIKPDFPAEFPDMPRLTGVEEADLDDLVFKVGAGSRFTTGKVCLVSVTLNLPVFSGVYWYRNLFGVESIDDAPFASVGDAGALVVRTDGKALGMIIAGDGNMAYVLPLIPLFKYLECDLIVQS